MSDPLPFDNQAEVMEQQVADRHRKQMRAQRRYQLLRSLMFLVSISMIGVGLGFYRDWTLGVVVVGVILLADLWLGGER